MSSFDVRSRFSQEVYGPTEFTTAQSALEIVAAVTDHEIVVDRIEISSDEIMTARLLGGATAKSVIYHIGAQGTIIQSDAQIKCGKGNALNLTTTIAATPNNYSVRVLYHLVKHT